jgi:hypothetical protein
VWRFHNPRQRNFQRRWKDDRRHHCYELFLTMKLCHQDDAFGRLRYTVQLLAQVVETVLFCAQGAKCSTVFRFWRMRCDDGGESCSRVKISRITMSRRARLVAAKRWSARVVHNTTGRRCAKTTARILTIIRLGISSTIRLRSVRGPSDVCRGVDLDR